MKQRSEECSCCWIVGFGVDEGYPALWGERMFSLDPQCPDHGSQEGADGREN